MSCMSTVAQKIFNRRNWETMEILSKLMPPHVFSNLYDLLFSVEHKRYVSIMKSLVPKRYKSILINLSKNVFSLPRKWQDENHYFCFKLHHSILGYKNIKNSIQILISKSYYKKWLFFSQNAINPWHVLLLLLLFFSKCNKFIESI